MELSIKYNAAPLGAGLLKPESNGCVFPIRKANEKKENQMNVKTFQTYKSRKMEEGKLGWIVLWLMGVPASVLFVLFLLRGCT